MYLGQIVGPWAHISDRFGALACQEHVFEIFAPGVDAHKGTQAKIAGKVRGQGAHVELNWCRFLVF